MALASHRRRWLVPPFIGATGVLYTIPSLAFFFLLLPITGRGTDTAIIALTAYTLQIIYRNIVAGLANVPREAKDAGRGMGMTDAQLLWRVELPLAVPEIIAGLRIATVSTVAIATLAVFAGGGRPGLGDRRRLEHHLQDQRHHHQRARDRDGDRLRRPAVAGPAAADALAVGGRGGRHGARTSAPSRGALQDGLMTSRSPSSTRSRAPSTSSSASASRSAAVQVGRPRPGLGADLEHLEVSGLALAGSLALALPLGLAARPPRQGRAVRGAARQRRPGDSGAGADRLPGRLHRHRAASTSRSP